MVKAAGKKIATAPRALTEDATKIRRDENRNNVNNIVKSWISYF